jgi:hypothetical protein
MSGIIWWPVLALTRDDLDEQHQANRVQALKKKVTKGDKKRKKEIDAQIKMLEKNFAEKCILEVGQLSSGGGGVATKIFRFTFFSFENIPINKIIPKREYQNCP